MSPSQRLVYSGVGLTKEHQAQLVEYFGQFGPALTAYLRPHRGSLGRHWLGIDRSRRTVVIEVSDSGANILVVGRWLGSAVHLTLREGAGRIAGGRFRRVLRKPAGTDVFRLGMKHFHGEGRCQVSLTTSDELRVQMESPDSVLGFIGPQLFPSLSPERKALLDGAQTEEALTEHGFIPADPPWVVCIVAHRVTDPLAGLDPDPLIAARGVADGILSYSGIIVDPVVAYRTAASELRDAVRSLSPENEHVLQTLLEEKPWILLHQAEYDDVVFRPRLPFLERLENEEDLQRSIEPDFVYHQPDAQSLVVEIESAKKRLLTTGTETGYRRPAAPASAAAFQISNYQRLFNGFAAGQLRRALGVADAWSFRFLLVVGSEEQEDFERRSWVNLRDHFGQAGVEVRTWDYYLDMLERRANAADFAGPKLGKAKS